MKYFKENKLFAGSIIILMVLWIISPSKGEAASISTLMNIKSVGMVLPPIFILIGLLDVWVPKEVMVKYMGEGSGLKGGLIAIFLGAMGAGPLVVAFPIAALLIKKGSKLSYVFLFLGAWTSVKLPIFMFELANFGSKFTLIHVSTSLVIYLIGAIVIEKVISKKSLQEIQEKAEMYA